MSSELNTFVGVALCCEKPTKKEKAHWTVKRCSNKKCPQYHSSSMHGKFCNECGSKIEKIHPMVKMDAYDIQDERFSSDSLFYVLDSDAHGQQGLELYTDNRSDKFQVDLDGNPYTDLIKLDVTTECLDFCKHFHEEIEILKEYYEKIEVKYIALQYWS